MNISAELVAIAILGVSLVSLGVALVTGDLRHGRSHPTCDNDVAKLGDSLCPSRTWNSAWPDWKWLDVRGVVADVRERNGAAGRAV